MKISICIPVHDPKNQYFEYLSQLFSSIASQTKPPKEVVITANHDIDYLSDLVKVGSNKFKVVFKKNNSKGSAENTNFAVTLATAQIIKIMHQDDYFIDVDALKKIKKKIRMKKWHLSSFDHFVVKNSTVENPMHPKLSEDLIIGNNQVGGPSVVAFKRKFFIPFDVRMCYMFDCDWYLKMWHNHGEPSSNKDLTVRIRIHDGQASNWAFKLLSEEILLTKSNHEQISSKSYTKCSCTKFKLNG